MGREYIGKKKILKEFFQIFFLNLTKQIHIQNKLWH